MRVGRINGTAGAKGGMVDDGVVLGGVPYSGVMVRLWLCCVV